RRHTRFSRDWSSDVCSSDLLVLICTSGGGPEFVRPNAMPEKDLIAFNKLDVKERNRIFIDHFVHPSVKQQDPQRFKEISDLRERSEERRVGQAGRSRRQRQQ